MDEQDGTYVVQVYSRFAPPEARPLLLRLAESATVEDCVTQALRRLATISSIVVVPSENVSDYDLVIADGEGGAPSFAPRLPFGSVLREVPQLEFPFMVAMVYNSGRNADSAPSSTGELGHTKNTIASQRSSTHKTLSVLEKEELDKRQAEIEAVRLENIRAHERKRAEKERKAFQHCESYEVLRREQCEKQRRDEERRQQLADIAAQEAAVRMAVLKEKHEEEKSNVLEEHRKQMEENLAEEKRRQAAAREYREQRLAQVQQEKEAARVDRLRLLAQEKERRMQQTLNTLLTELDDTIAKEREEQEQRLEKDRYTRHTIERTQADLRSIAVLEDRRSIVMNHKRDGRINASIRTEEERRSREQSALDETRKEAADEEARRLEWQQKQERQAEVLASRLELMYREQSHQSTAPL